MSVEWTTTLCPQGEGCWCRGIAPKDMILYKSSDYDEEYSIVGYGVMTREVAEYVVMLHNNHVAKKQKISSI